MNKVLFKEGGQPIYLDDLSTMQDFSSDAIEMLLQGLGVDTDVTYFVKKPEVTYNGTVAKFTNGSLWVKDIGLVPLIGVTDLDLGITGKAYVKISKTETMPRSFEDGQIRTTRQTVIGTIVNTPANSDYVYSEIPDMLSQLSFLIDKNNRTDFQTVEVKWMNGYGGVVEVKEIFGGYRYHVKAKSLASSWDETGKFICSGAFHPSVSSMFMTGGDTPARDNPHYLILDGEGLMELSGGTEVDGPINAPIDVTFDVLGDPWI